MEKLGICKFSEQISRRSLLCHASQAVLGTTFLISCGDKKENAAGIPQGHFDNPLTQDLPGNYAEGKDSRNPQIFGNLVSLPGANVKLTRVWIEVLGTPNPEASQITDVSFETLSIETLCADGVTEIRLVDEDSRDILASRILASTWQARFICELSFSSQVKRIAAYAYIPSKGGWWRGPIVDVSNLEAYLPNADATAGCVGSFRRPLSRFSPGFLDKPNVDDTDDLALWKDLKHQGHWQSYGRKGVRLIFADFNNASDASQVQAHGDWSAAHNFLGAYLLDQNDQLIPETEYLWGDGTEIFKTIDGKISERKDPVTTSPLALGAVTKDTPYLTFPKLPEGVTKLRLIWLCSIDGWWECTYANIA